MLLTNYGSIKYFWGTAKAIPPRYILLCIKIGISFSLLYNINNDTNKKELKNMPTLNYTELFINIQTKFIYDILFDEGTPVLELKSVYRTD